MDSVHQKMFVVMYRNGICYPKNGRGGKLKGVLQNLHFHTYLDPFCTNNRVLAIVSTNEFKYVRND